MKLWLAVALGGALGAMARFGVGLSAARLFGAQRAFIGTLCVNALGCFLAGLLAVWLSRAVSGTDLARAFLLVGILGGFTTFSAFGLETAQMLQAGHWRNALLYVCASIGFGIAGAALALWLARRAFMP